MPLLTVQRPEAILLDTMARPYAGSSPTAGNIFRLNYCSNSTGSHCPGLGREQIAGQFLRPVSLWPIFLRLWHAGGSCWHAVGCAAGRCYVRCRYAGTESDTRPLVSVGVLWHAGGRRQWCHWLQAAHMLACMSGVCCFVVWERCGLSGAALQRRSVRQLWSLRR
jgi:hypothetical protein